MACLEQLQHHMAANVTCPTNDPGFHIFFPMAQLTAFTGKDSDFSLASHNPVEKYRVV